MFEKDNFEKIKLEKETSYKTFGEVYCPYFKEKILFSALGLDHLKFKKPRIARSEEDQFMRFKLLNLAPLVVSLSHTVQGIRTIKSFEEIRINNRKEHILKNVIYYEFIAVIQNYRVKIILKEIEGGSKVFLSIVPAWQYDRKTRKRILSSSKNEN
jgi:hypothetical protein